MLTILRWGDRAVTRFDVRDFGAVGDGVTNDRVALQAALDAAYEAGGGEVYIPTGMYIITGTPDYPTGGGLRVRDNTQITGDGMGQTVIKLADGWSGNVTGVLRTPYGQGNANISVRDLTLDGNRQNTSGKVDGWFNGFIPGKQGFDDNILLERMEIKNMSGYGFDPHEQTLNLVIRDSIAHGNGLDGFVADYIRGDSVYENNLAYNNDRHGFNIVTSTGDLVLRNNVAYGNGSTGTVVQRGSEDIAIPYNILIEGGSLYGNAAEGVLIKMSDDVRITDVDIYGNGTNGVRVFGARDVQIEGNRIYGNSLKKHNGYAEIRIQEYDDTSGVSRQIHLSDGTLVRGNEISASGSVRASFGIEQLGMADHAMIYGNNISGTVKGDMSLTGVFNVLRAPDILGTEYSDYYKTTTGNQWIDGQLGDDQIYGGSGNDTLLGSAGNDSLYGENDADVLLGGDGHDILSGGKGNDTLLGGEGDDVLDGNSDNDRLDGGGGNDTLLGGTGNDLLEGWYGHDRLDGGSGNDTLMGGHGSDTLLGGSGDDRLDGNAGADILTGNSGVDTFYFSSRLHSIFQPGRYDIITDFEPGVDRINLDGLGFTQLTTAPLTQEGELRLEYNAAENLTFVRSDQTSFAFALTGNFIGVLGAGNIDFVTPPFQGIITLSGNESNNTLTGGSADNVILGKGGNDSLTGGAGNDTLDGGAGKDTLDGGEGADVYRFSSVLDSTKDSNTDRIVSFTPGIDLIDLSGLGFIGLDTDGGKTEAGELRLTYSIASDRTYVRTDQLSFEFFLDGNFTQLLTDADFIF